jgi:phosphoribosylformylglycinamidine cyclo-ligase
MANRSITYKAAGVDVQANREWVERIHKLMARTFSPRVRSRPGGFAGLFELDFPDRLLRRNYRQPLLVGCADGVGTKLLLAAEADRLDTIGIDLVAMNVNDLICCGAEPLFFLDYLAVHKLEPSRLTAVMEGMAEGCRRAGCALLGGETAEMPDLYRRGDLDLAGFAVGVVERRRAIDPRRVAPGDVLVALPSTGVHSNGFTLIRKLIRRAKLRLDRPIEELGATLADALLAPTAIYVEPVLATLKQYRVKRVISAMAHITGGGLPENVGRVLPRSCTAVIDTGRWTPPPAFAFLQKLGADRREMFRVFNMGVGFVLAVRPAFARGVMRKLRRAGEHPFPLGHVKRGDGTVDLR